MAWVEGTEKKSMVINAPVEKVLSFFAEPQQLRACLTQIESAEEIEPNVWKWTLREKNEKGIKFQGIYTVRYTRESDSKVVWETVDAETMRAEGTVVCRALGNKTEIEYEETIATDLPIPSLAAKVFRPIVAREIRKDVGSYLDLAKAHLEKAHAGSQH